MKKNVKQLTVWAGLCVLSLAVGWAVAAHHYQQKLDDLTAQLETAKAVQPAPPEPVAPRHPDWTPAAEPTPEPVYTNAIVADLERPTQNFQPPPWRNHDGTNGWHSPFSPEERAAWQERMASQMVARAESIRTNFIAKANLKEEEAVRFDVLIEAMNLRLKDQVDVWTQYRDESNMPPAELRARIMKEINSVYVLTYDELDRNMPEGWRTVSGEDFNLSTFIDPEVMTELRPLMRRSRSGPSLGGYTPPQSSTFPQRNARSPGGSFP